jgi:hypothetical protein
MQDWIIQLKHYSWEVINTWAGYLTGGLVMAAVWLQAQIKPGWQLPRKYALPLAAFFFYLAGFEAWKSQYQRVLATEFNPVSFKFENTPRYIKPPESRPRYYSDWAVLFDIETKARLDGAHVYLYSVTYRPDSSHRFEEVCSVHTEIRQYAWDASRTEDVSVSQRYALFEALKDGTRLGLVSSAPEPELEVIKNMLPGEYKLELVVAAKSLANGARAVANVKWTGNMSNFQMTLIKE